MGSYSQTRYPGAFAQNKVRSGVGADVDWVAVGGTALEALGEDGDGTTLYLEATLDADILPNTNSAEMSDWGFRINEAAVLTSLEYRGNFRTVSGEDFYLPGTSTGFADVSQGQLRLTFAVIPPSSYASAQIGVGAGVRSAATTTINATPVEIVRNTWQGGTPNGFNSYFGTNSSGQGVGRANDPNLTGIYNIINDEAVSDTVRMWKVSAKFNYTLNAPSAFALLTPADEATDTALKPTLSWEHATGVGILDGAIIGTGQGYRLRVSLASDLSAPVVDVDEITGESYTLTANLEPLTEYYWGVDAVNEDGTTACTAVFSFTTGEGRYPGAARDRSRSRARATNPNDYL